jgi:ABC-2 type transport system permease protein
LIGLLRYEWLLLARDGRLRIAASLLAALAVFAVAAGISQHNELARDKVAATSAERARWLVQGEKDPHAAAHYGQYVFQSPPSLAAFEPGISRHVGVTVWLEAHAQNQFIFRAAQDEASGMRHLQPGAAALLQLLLPLALLILGGGAMASDRTSGALRAVLATGVTPARWLLARAIAALSLCAMCLIPALVVALALIHDSANADAGLWWRSAGFVLAYALYLGVFATLGLALGTAARSARGVLALAMAAWVFACLIGPRLAADAADRVYPLPSSVAMSGQIQRELERHNHPDQREARKRELLARHAADDVAALPVNWRGVELDAAERHGNAVFDRVHGALTDTMQRQNHFYLLLGSLFSPLPSLQTLSMAAAGTDYAHHVEFARHAETYRRLLVNTLNAELIPQADGRGESPYRAGAELWASIPAFEARTMSPRSALSLPAAWGALAVWAAVAGAALAIAARRIRP